MMAKRTLRVFLQDRHVADLQSMKGNDIRCRYTAAALAHWSANAAVLSCSLPLQRNAQPAERFLRGLLPEGNHLLEAARLARVSANDTYSLLARFGRDIAGALVITETDNPGNGRWSSEVYQPDELVQEIESLSTNGLALRDDSELSIAGIQNKLLLVQTKEGAWARPVHGQPSTHILKLDDAVRPGLVEAEHACLTLAHRVGLSASTTEFLEIGGYRCIVVERYDRVADQFGNISRVHQEDACQALAIDIDAARGRGKYEQHGGPDFESIAKLFDRHALDAVTEKLALLDLAVFTAAIGNADLHGKNVSLLHDEQSFITLAPIYDCVPTAMWSTLRATSAMSIAGHFANVPTLTEIVTEANRWGLPRPLATTRASNLLNTIRTESTHLPPPLAHLIQSRTKQILNG